MKEREDAEKRVKKAQHALDLTAQAIAMLDIALDNFDTSAAQYHMLRDYYGSDNWFADVQAHNNYEMSHNFNAHILSEDGAYNTIAKRHDLAIRLLETGTRILKEH